MAPKEKLKLRIALTADPEIPVPPQFYGGIERIIHILVKGLIARGHEVILFAHPSSQVPCRFRPYPGRRSLSFIDCLQNMVDVSRQVLRDGFDLVHSFGRLAYILPLLPLPILKIMSYQRTITPRNIFWAEKLSRGTLHFVGPSRYLTKAYDGKVNWHVVYNGAPRDAYQFFEKVNHDAPLVFLGRIEEIKGAHLAIEVALRSGRKLMIAGNVPEEAKHLTYFNERIAPPIDGKKILYVGPVTDGQKNEILGKALALLMPVLWDELFGIVMAEAMACGTPVIALNRGAIPEIIQNGVNGFLCDSVDEMVVAVDRIQEIDRRVCRQMMEEKFSDQSIVTAYEKLYLEILHS